jgi:hypothetical protein
MPSGCGKPLSRPKILHSIFPVVKTTTREKVGILSNPVGNDYVNWSCIRPGPIPCGKLLWKNLWRMWKTAGFQQVFRCFPQKLPPVERLVYSPVYFPVFTNRFRVTLPDNRKQLQNISHKKVGKPQKMLSKNRGRFWGCQIFCEKDTNNFLVSSSACWKYFSYQLNNQEEYHAG